MKWEFRKIVRKSVLSFDNPIFFLLSLSLFHMRIVYTHTYIHIHTHSHTFRSINVTGPYLFSLFRDISLFKILFSSSPPFPILAVFAFVFRSFCHSHLLVDISSFSPPYLSPFQFRPLFVLFLSLSLSTCAALGYPFLLQSAHHFST